MSAPETDVRTYDVGWSFEGHPTREQKRAELAKMLRKFSEHSAAWAMPPEIREMCFCGPEHENTVSLRDFGRRYSAEMPTCAWAVYGVVRGYYPPEGVVPDGVRLPSADPA